MQLLLIAIFILAAGGIGSLISGNNAGLSTRIGYISSIAGSTIGFFAAAVCFLTGDTDALSLAWHVPAGSFSVGIDPLSSFFLLPVFFLSAIAAIYGIEYMRSYQGKKSPGSHWFFYNLLTAGMAMVLIARNGVLFLIAWEIMSLAPFFLVTYDDEKQSARSAGWTYLVAAHLGALPLLVLFVLLAQPSGSMDFSTFSPALISPAMAGSVIKKRSLRANENVSRSRSMSPSTAWRESVGSTATAMATPNTPIGRWIRRMA